MERLETPLRAHALDGSPEGVPRPDWLRLLPALVRPPELTRRQWQVLGLVGVASLFDVYDLSLFGFALKQIQAGLSIPEAQVGLLGSLVRFGALPAFFVTLAADRIGRRRVLLGTILAYTLITGATAFAPGPRSFVVLQFLARTFSVAEMLLAVVVITEEFGPEVRGWGIGALGILQALGSGLAAIVFGLFGAVPGGWRALYLIGLVPLLLLAWWRRSLPETPHFEGRRPAASGWRAALAPARSLVRMYPGRFAASAGIVLLAALSGSAAGLFEAKYLQDARGWSPADIATLVICGGAFAILGNTVAGRLSDGFGRKRVIVALGFVAWITIVLFYDAEGGWLIPLWIVHNFCGMGSGVASAVLLSELFPTSYRSTASGARAVIDTSGAVLGLALESVLYPITGSHWTSIRLLSCIALPTLPMILFCFPETAGRALDDVSPER